LPDDVADATGMVSLASLRAKIGVTFSLQVTGAADPVRGSDVYTDDSSIAAAAVHAGVLRAGEKGYVRVTILAGQQEYAASEQNGIKSGSAGPWSGSFSVARGPGH
jgi:LCCL domain